MSAGDEVFERVEGSDFHCLLLFLSIYMSCCSCIYAAADAPPLNGCYRWLFADELGRQKQEKQPIEEGLVVFACTKLFAPDFSVVIPAGFAELP